MKHTGGMLVPEGNPTPTFSTFLPLWFDDFFGTDQTKPVPKKNAIPLGSTCGEVRLVSQSDLAVGQNGILLHGTRD